VKKLDLLYEGKAKKVFSTDITDSVLIEYKDELTAFDGKKKDSLYGKGIYNNLISNILFTYLNKEGIKTHFVEQISNRETLVKMVEIIQIEVLVRNKVAGSLSKRLGWPEGTNLDEVVIEFCYKNDKLGDPMINDYHIRVLKLASNEEIQSIVKQSMEINEILKALFLKHDLELIDFKLEFGRCNGEVILADEISPDTCRLWDLTTSKKLDKDRFRRDLGEVSEAYLEVLQRLKSTALFDFEIPYE